MPLFKRSRRATGSDANDITSHKHNTRASYSPERKGIFSSNHRTNNSATSHNTRASSSSPHKKRIFSINRRVSTSSSESESQSRSNSMRTHRSGTGIFGHRLRNKSRSIDHDPSIVSARQKVSEAEQAEKEADSALMEARKHVQLARDHVGTLEQEAIEEARMAKLKQAEAKVIHKTVKSLGRHGP